MSEPMDIPKSKMAQGSVDDYLTASHSHGTSSSSNDDRFGEPTTPGWASSTPGSPMLLSRNSSYSGSQSLQEDEETPFDKLGLLEILNNLVLPTRLEKWQATIIAQKDKIAKTTRTTGTTAKDRAVKEWKKRLPTSDEQLAKYRSRVKRSVDQLHKRWGDTATITAKEKVAFISAVLNVFISGYLIGAFPQYFYYWFTAQFAYFMPIRYYTYRRTGYHYFLADLCYFVNFLLLFSVWLFPQSKRLLISTYCLAYGNNAIAIAMWRNSLVFHSLDKVTSLFIHVMPPVTLHCLIHLTPPEFLQERFPAAYDVKFSQPGSPEHYSLWGMVGWTSVPYALWQLSYHFLITVRRREKIAAGRPTSFTWLRKSYSNTAIGKLVINLPEVLQEPAFMFIQYSYAILTILPCPLWFWYRWWSAGFLMTVFVWSVWNGANYYMDVFGKKFQKELEQMKRDVAKWQSSPGGTTTPGLEQIDGDHRNNGKDNQHNLSKNESIDQIPLLDETAKSNAKTTGAQVLDEANEDSNISERK